MLFRPSSLLLASAIALAMTACSPSPAPTPSPPSPKAAAEPADPPFPTAPKEEPATLVEQARQATQVFVTLHAKPGQPAIAELISGGERWVNVGKIPFTVCLETTNDTPVLVNLALQGRTMDKIDAAPGTHLFVLQSGNVLCPIVDATLQADLPLALAWAVYPTNGQPIERLAENGQLKDETLEPGGKSMIRLGDPMEASPRPVPWPGHPEATPALLEPTAQAQLESVLAERAAEQAQRRASPKPDGVEATP